MDENNTNKRRSTVYALMWTVFAVCGVFMCKDARDRNTENEVKKQVETYEKSFPGYIEQKQKIEHYRDSLMRVKGL